MIDNTKRYAVFISTGREYGPKVGWDTLYTSRTDAEACAERARSHDGLAAKVVSMTTDEAAEYGWTTEQ